LLGAQTVLWLRSGTDTTLILTGTPSLAGSRTVSGASFLSGWNFDTMPLTTNLPVGLDAWIWDAAAQSWHEQISGVLAAAIDAPGTLDAGDALFARSLGNVTLAAQSTALTIRFYHQDHLGSSSVLTDSNGQLVEESAFFPFGTPRNEFQPRLVHEDYEFTQKERDKESGLQYFEARYLHGTFARFIRVDPTAILLTPQMLSNPQELDTLSYCGSNPLSRTDVTGLSSKDLSSYGCWAIAGGVAAIAFAIPTAGTSLAGGLALAGGVAGATVGVAALGMSPLVDKKDGKAVKEAMEFGTAIVEVPSAVFSIAALK